MQAAPPGCRNGRTPVRKVTYAAAASFDGYIAGLDEAIDWLRWSAAAASISRESRTGVDTLLMGRKTYEFAARAGGEGRGPSSVRIYVFSRSMVEAPEGTNLVREDAADFVRRLKEAQGGDILVMGGGELGSALVEGGVADEIGFNIHPVLLGTGTPMFREMSRRVELSLVEARAIAKDCLFVRYRILN